MFVPRRGPHCPRVIIIRNPPARLELVELVFAVHIRTMEVVREMSTARKVPIYLEVTDSVVPSKIKPIAESKENRACEGPSKSHSVRKQKYYYDENVT
jgi:hypothetical protein